MAGPADEVIDLYSRRAADWDADRRKSLFERPWLEAFLAHIPQDGTVLDLGCGSGEPIAAWLIAQGRRLTGVDASPGLVDLCRTRFPDHDWIVADMRRLDLGQVFDGVIAWHSAIHLTPDDHERMFEIYARHVSPGGVLMFTSGSDRGETVGEWRGEALYHGSLSLADWRTGLRGAGFEILRHAVDDVDCGGATVWLARRVGGKMVG